MGAAMGELVKLGAVPSLLGMMAPERGSGATRTPAVALASPRSSSTLSAQSSANSGPHPAG